MLSYIFTVIIGINLKCFPDIAPKKIFFLRGAKNVGKHKIIYLQIVNYGKIKYSVGGCNKNFRFVIGENV